jgi:predicted dehydrogenase
MKNIAVVGLGSIAERHRMNLKSLYPRAKIFGIPSSGKMPKSSVDNCDEVVTSIKYLSRIDIDFAIIASPSTFHAEHSLPFIRSGVPVLIEKPMAASLEDANIIAKEATKFNTPVALGYCLRYMPSALLMKDFITNKYLGSIYNAAIEVGDFLPSWRKNKHYLNTVSANAHLGGGVLLELSHEFDYASWMFGGIDINAAFLGFSSELSLDVEDSADILAKDSHGAVITLHLDFLQKSPFRQMRLLGEKGILKWDLLKNTIFSDDNLKACLYDGSNWDKNLMYIDMLKDFEKLITGQINRCVNIDNGIVTLELVEKIRSSAVEVDRRA